MGEFAIEGASEKYQEVKKSAGERARSMQTFRVGKVSKKQAKMLRQQWRTAGSNKVGRVGKRRISVRR